MEEQKKKNGLDMNDKEIVYSQSIKAGKRIYYLDVKKSRRDEMFLAITESKKVIMGEGEDSQISFEKHKIFLYKEDFEKFMNGLRQAISFIEEKDGPAASRKEDTEHEALQTTSEASEDAQNTSLNNDIKIDIDF